MNSSSISWTEKTWNPIFGCTKVSPGCQNCYAERIATRWGKDFSKVEWKPQKLREPLMLREPSMIFVNSMSDLFHESVPNSFIQQVFDVIEEADWHTYQILTKRPDRMLHYFRDVDDRGFCGKNVWLGVSVEMALYTSRIATLQQLDAEVRFVSFEPLLGSVLPLCLKGIAWVITGGESDFHHPRPASAEWFRQIRYEAQKQGVAYFHKQNGGSTKCKCHNVWGCQLLDGQTYHEYPKIDKRGEVK